MVSVAPPHTPRTPRYTQWLTNDRQVNSRTLTIAARALNHLSRFLYHEHSTVRPGSGVLAYSDIPVVQEMRALQNMYRKQTKVEPRATDESKKFVEWPEFLWAVDELKRECAGALGVWGCRVLRVWGVGLRECGVWVNGSG